MAMIFQLFLGCYLISYQPINWFPTHHSLCIDERWFRSPPKLGTSLWKNTKGGFAKSWMDITGNPTQFTPGVILNSHVTGGQNVYHVAFRDYHQSNHPSSRICSWQTIPIHQRFWWLNSQKISPYLTMPPPNGLERSLVAFSEAVALDVFRWDRELVFTTSKDLDSHMPNCFIWGFPWGALRAWDG